MRILHGTLKRYSLHYFPYGPLDAAELREQTLVIFTTDHGIAYPFHKCTLYDTGIGVALIIDYPGNPARGSVIDALVSHLDIVPTVCELTGISKPDCLEGKSLLPLFKGEAEQIRDELFAEVTFHARYEPQRAIRTRDYKLIKRFGPDPGIVAVNIDGSASKQHLFNSGIERIAILTLQLYDLNIDPLERVNVATEPEYAEVRTVLSERLDAWMHRTNDPLLHGDVALPAGAFQDAAESYNPDEGSREYGIE